MYLVIWFDARFKVEPQAQYHKTLAIAAEHAMHLVNHHFTHVTIEGVS